MARINLLPWREELRKQKQQDFLTGIGIAVVITCLILAGVYMYIEGLKEYQQHRNQMLKNEISIVNRKIKEIKDIEEKKNQLLTKIDVIQKLQESRPEIVHLFDELAKVTPDGVHLKKFVQSGSSLTLTGMAQSNARVSAYMRAIEASPWLMNPKLSVIKRQGQKGSPNDFTMMAQQGQEKDKKKEEGKK
ncbi:PilN domain-containing protein [Methylomarinum sp. Ch1-1]|uniref:PilN domain-containing protein n=1 Tax=Methylomarinum roseum TaxID=3067653 RepID=A0AAU7NYX6_9GAMM|nr:PilN domain-containing protein [Methylomarinum sp. Ch1-1]MDP4522132.1 PilN domain-containing protein [Methylomarinum sp. Ch1-1]